ncbi:hypothetical protein ACXYMT_13630 [Salinimicrobium sp. CAU 1759]
MTEPVIKRTTYTDLDFIMLVKELYKHLAVTYGEDHAFFDQFNKLTAIKHAIVLYPKRNSRSLWSI